MFNAPDSNIVQFYLSDPHIIMASLAFYQFPWDTY